MISNLIPIVRRCKITVYKIDGDEEIIVGKKMSNDILTILDLLFCEEILKSILL